MMSSSGILVLLIAGLIAGVINAMAGGARVLVFPLLIALGLSAVVANATCMFALGLGIVGSCYGFRKHIPTVRPWLFRFGWASIAGGLLGAWLLTVTPAKAFSNFAPFLMLLATVLFMVQGSLSRWASRSGKRKVESGKLSTLVYSPRPASIRVDTECGETAKSNFPLPDAPNFHLVAIQFAIALYGGYFGAGIGILMLAVFGYMGFANIHHMNTLKTILSALVTLVAAAYYMWAGLIDWPHAGWLTLGATAGYFCGAHFSQKIPQKLVRQIIIVIGLILSAWMMWRMLV